MYFLCDGFEGEPNLLSHELSLIRNYTTERVWILLVRVLYHSIWPGDRIFSTNPPVEATFEILTAKSQHPTLIKSLIGQTLIAIITSIDQVDHMKYM